MTALHLHVPAFISPREIRAESFFANMTNEHVDFFDIDHVAFRLLEIYAITRSLETLPLDHPVLADLTNYSKQITSNLETMRTFLELPEIAEYFESADLLLAMQSLAKVLRAVVRRLLNPTFSLPDDIGSLELHSIAIIKRYLFSCTIASPIPYEPPNPHHVEHVRIHLFATKRQGIDGALQSIQLLADAPFTAYKRTIPPLMRTISAIAQHDPAVFKPFESRWGKSYFGIRGDKIVLPSRKELYHFFHDWQHILRDFGLIGDIQKMRRIKNAYYGQRLGMHITALDLSWLL